jgi:hypothetical protein
LIPGLPKKLEVVANIATFARIDCKLQNVPCKVDFKFKEGEDMVCSYASLTTKEPDEDNH